MSIEPTAQQQQAIEASAPLHVVSAGAGSGKTLVLVERVVRLARAGDDPGRMLGITFTEKGAAELKRRLVRRFQEQGMAKQRREAEAAYLSTIHGFCARVLREWPVEAGIDPDFGIVDPIEEAIFYEDRLEELRGDAEFFSLANEYGYGYRDDQPKIFSLIRKLIDSNRERQGTVDELRAASDPDQILRKSLERRERLLRERWREMLGGLEDIEGLTTEAYVGGKSGKKYARLCSMLEGLSPDEPRWDLAEDLWECIGFYSRIRKPEKPTWKESFEPARSIAYSMRPRNFDAEDDERREREAARRKALLLGWAVDVWSAYEAFKADRNLLDYTDLQRRALALLQESPAALKSYRNRFRHILLDEAQDTNPLQYRILRQLWTGDNSWFVVGDPKQAIYGFRNADLELFLDLEDRAGEDRTELPDNFRSRGEILDAVNAVGHAFWDDDPRLNFFELNPGLDFPNIGDEPRVELCVVEKREDSSDSPDAESTDADSEPPDAESEPPDAGGGRTRHESLARTREREARWVAERLLRLHSTAAPIRDPDSPGGTRPFGYRDAAVLMRTRAFSAYERVFDDAGIPYATLGAGNFFEGLEVADLLNGLAVVANPFDDLALLSALRSPLCGLDDDALFRLRLAQKAAGGSTRYWDVLRTAELKPTDRERALEFQQTMDRLRSIRDAAPPVRLLSDLIDATDYRARLFAESHGRGRVANVGRLELFARRHSELSLGDFLRRARRAERHLREDPHALPIEPDEPVVTLSTVHGAKGLEWPVVFLADLARNYWRSTKTSGVTPDGELYLAAPPGPTADDGDLKAPFSSNHLRGEIDDAAAREAQRLFYVGMTRARELLIMSGAAKADAKTSNVLKRPIHWLRGRLHLDEPADSADSADSADPADSGEPAEEDVEVRSWSGARVRIHRVGADRDPRPAPAPRPKSLAELHRAEIRAGRPIPVRRNGAQESGPLKLPEPLVVHQPPARQESVTRIGEFLRCPLIFRFSELGLPEFGQAARRRDSDIAADGPRDRGGEDSSVGGAEFGNALHRAFERADFGADPATEARRLAARMEGDPEWRRQGRRLIERGLRSALADEIRRARRVYREVPFHVPVGQTVLHGYIDLLFADQNGEWHIVDWKSNAVHDQQRLRTLVAQHTPQVQLYAAALSGIPGFGSPAGGRLVYLRAGKVESIPVDPEALDRAVERAGEAAARMGAGEYATSAGPKCLSCGYRKLGWCEIGMAYEAP